MRAIRSLAPVEEAAPDKRASRGTAKWSIAQRLLFTFGLLIAASGFWFSGNLQMSRLQLDTEEVEWDDRLDVDLELLETMNLEGAWETWTRVRDTDIGPYSPPTFVHARNASKVWGNIALWTALAGFAGLVMIGIAIALPKQRVFENDAPLK